MSRVKPITLSEARERLTLSVPEVAYLLGASASWTYSALERGELPGLQRIGGRVLVSAGVFLAHFEQAS